MSGAFSSKFETRSGFQSCIFPAGALGTFPQIQVRDEMKLLQLVAM